MDDLDRGILRTLCFADALDAALTPMEVKRLFGVDQGKEATLAEIMHATGPDGSLAAAVVSGRGLLCLKGREALIEERLLKLAVSEEKWLVAMRALRRIRHIPWIRLAAVCNTVGMGMARKGSDVDLFVVAQRKRLWAVRLLLHAALAVGSLARRGRDAADRVCLSFSVSETAENLHALRKSPTDPYMSVWLATICPSLERDGAYARLLAKNVWLTEILPGVGARMMAAPRTVHRSLLARVSGTALAGPFGDAIDSFARRLQRPRILAKKVSRVHAGGTDVVVTDDVLKFHEEDRRDEIRERFLARAAAYGV